MKIRNIQLKNQRILAVGPLYDKTEKLIQIDKMYNDNTPLIFIGDLCYPFKTHNDISKRLNEFRGFAEGKNIYYILGDKDLSFIKQVYSSHADIYDWFMNQCIACKFTFENNSSVMLLHGGILEKHKTISDLDNDLEVSFVENLPDPKKNWHENYNGRFGYIIASHPASKENTIETYNYSMSLDTNCYKTNILIMQEFTDKGVGETFYL